MPPDLIAPTFAMVSTDIRRDLVEPLRHFRRLKLVHFYRRASYNDLLPSDLDATLLPYGNPADLFLRLLRCKPTVVQGVEPFAIRLLPYLYAVFAASLIRKIPMMIVTLENRPLEEKHGSLGAAALRALLRPILSRARAIISLNEGSRRNILSVGQFADKTCRMMYGTWGVNPDEFCPALNGNEPSFGPGPVLLFVGRLAAEKGVFDLLAAFERIREGVPSTKLVMIGSGPDRDEVEKVVSARHRAGEVVLCGTIKNRELAPYYRAADVFVAPSKTTRKWEEQVGMTSIQAMASGLAVVSTRSGAIPEYVSDGVSGLLVPEGNPRALAEAILRALRDEPLRRRLAQAARAQALAIYDARKNVLRAEELILSLVRAG